ncbi:MAG: phage terminase large subunit [Pseudomonadota bacterium]
MGYDPASGALRIECSEKFHPFLQPAPFKAAFGGRGGMKSFFFADLHLARAVSQPGYRALCLREVQRSIKESSKRLLEERIQAHGLGHLFEVQEQSIKTPGGGEFVFQGLQNHTAESVKSFQGFDVADIEEAQTIKQRSLDLLIPTIIRKDGAEIWARWNPRHDTDPIDQLFRGPNIPPGSIVVEVGWRDNPYLNDQTLKQIKADYEADPEKAEHVWGGGYEVFTEGAYYAKLISKLESEGRAGGYPHSPELPVTTGWDLGVDDYTAIWFFQEHFADGKPRIRVIDYYETSGDGADLIAQDAIHSKPYTYAMHRLPHDVAVREWGAGARSRADTLRTLGVSPVMTGVRQGPEERINATRALLPLCEFDDNENVRLGLRRLKRYSRRMNDSMGVFQGPLHDENSHGADAFGEYAINSPLLQAAKVDQGPKAPTDYKPRRNDEGSLTI